MAVNFLRETARQRAENRCRDRLIRREGEVDVRLACDIIAGGRFGKAAVTGDITPSRVHGAGLRVAAATRVSARSAPDRLSVRGC